MPVLEPALDAVWSSRGRHSLLVWKGRTANLGVRASLVERVIAAEVFPADPPLDLTERLDMDPAASPVRIVELRTSSGSVRMQTTGPLTLAVVEETDLLTLPPLLRAQDAFDLFEGFAVTDGVASVWILDPSSLARIARSESAARIHP